LPPRPASNDLRAGFGLNYAAIALVMDLLDQIERLRGERQWTRIA